MADWQEARWAGHRAPGKQPLSVVSKVFVLRAELFKQFCVAFRLFLRTGVTPSLHLALLWLVYLQCQHRLWLSHRLQVLFLDVQTVVYGTLVPSPVGSEPALATLLPKLNAVRLRLVDYKYDNTVGATGLRRIAWREGTEGKNEMSFSNLISKQ